MVTACGRNAQDVRGGGTGDTRIPDGQSAVAGIADSSGLPAEGTLARVAIGDLAGAGGSMLDASIRSPFGGDAAAIDEGRERFESMNCAACHGYDLKGGMGPNLTDTYWRYGGSPADIYKSIFEGRPQGMPAWGRAIPSPVIWKLVAYVESRGGAFTGSQADRARQGDLGGRDTAAGSTLKGRNSAP